jgi:cell division septum initiation protein DivIVA
MGKIDELKQLLHQISQDSKRVANELEGLGGKLKKSQGTANTVGSGLGRSLQQSLSSAESTTKKAAQELHQLSRSARQQADALP